MCTYVAAREYLEGGSHENVNLSDYWISEFHVLNIAKFFRIFSVVFHGFGAGLVQCRRRKVFALERQFQPKRAGPEDISIWSELRRNRLWSLVCLVKILRCSPRSLPTRIYSGFVAMKYEGSVASVQFSSSEPLFHPWFERSTCKDIHSRVKLLL